jgi:HEAT repeat protein
MCSSPLFQIVCLGILLLASPDLRLSFAGAPETTAPHPLPSSESVDELTRRLLSLGETYARASSEAREPILKEIIATAQARTQALSALARDDPRAFLAASLLTQEQRENLPAEVQSDLEEPGVFEGWLGVMIADDFAHGRSRTYYSLVDALGETGRRFSLNFADGRGPQVVSGGKFRVKGVKIGAAIVIASQQDMEFIPGETALRGKPMSYWVASATAKDPVLRAKAVEALGGLGWGSTPEVISILCNALKDPVEDVRVNAAVAIHGSFANKELALPALRAALKDKNEYVRIYAALALVQSVAKPQEEAKEAAPVLLKAMASEDEWIRVNAFRELGNIGPYPQAALPQLMEHVESDMAWERSQAARGLGEIGPAAKRAVPALRRMLLERKEKDAALPLAKIDPKAAVPSLTKALDYDETRFAALVGLAEVGPRAKTAEEAVRRCMNDPNESIRKLAAETLEAIEDNTGNR